MKLSAQAERPKLLVIDDDAAVRESLQLIFEEKYDVVTCDSGVEGVALVDPLVHVVILDIRLRRRDGFWTYQAIRKQYAEVPIIFYSAYQDLKDPYEVINDYRPFAFLPKDGDLSRIQRVVDEAVMMHAQKLRRDRRLLATERLATVGTLAAAAAHEINNPLGFIIGNLELVEEDLAAGTIDRQDMLDSIKDSLTGAWRIAEIVQSLKSYGRFERQKKWRADVREVLQLSAKIADGELRHRANLVTHFESLAPVGCEPGVLSQIFVNLLVNAAQALPVGKASENTIEVRTRCDYSSSELIVEVSDTGPGIPEDIREHIFDPFFTTKSSEDGTGLGLFVTHNLVSSAGGSIKLLEPEPGRGAVFELRLPMVQTSDTHEISKTPADTEKSKTPRRRILVIDDEAMIGLTMQRMLSVHDVEWVDNGHAALKQIGEHDFDVIFCDLMMPECGGVEVYEYIAAHHAGFEERIVFLTGGVFDNKLKDFLDSLDNVVLSKPVSRQMLLTTVESIAKASSAKA